MFSLSNEQVVDRPLFTKDTLVDSVNVRKRLLVGAIHVDWNGRLLYLAN
jgi:hypothetical protein